MDGNGQPIVATTTAANGDECLEVNKLLKKTCEYTGASLRERRMVVLEADRGYDRGWLRQALLARGIFPLIPYRKIAGRVIPKTEDVLETFGLTKKRWQVERAFAWLKKRCRRLLVRWERKELIWAGFVTLGIVYTWLKNLVG